MAGQEQGHALVAELAVGHPPAALLVLGVQEHREQVAAVIVALAPLGDDAEEDAIELTHGRGDAQVRRRRQPSRNDDRASQCWR